MIASAGADCSEIMLKRRIDSMREAVADHSNGVELHLKFLDRNAISGWVSSHPSVAIWLRRYLKRSILTGWQPFGRWSSTPQGETDDLICEEGLVFHFESGEEIRKLPEALDVIRKLLTDGSGAVRIVGLSGIGKSRIVQALFESQSVGSVSALPESHAVYTDIGLRPDPPPIGMLEALIERNDPAVLVVDNCSSETHQVLARKLAERPGVVRLITVEYDVRIDRPEETDVIRVEAEGGDIVELLIRRRFKTMSMEDAGRLAKLAQGNARLGFALANAAPHTGSLSTFEDETLFKRLFQQRGAHSEELVQAAEVLSLVYYFEVDGDEQPDENPDEKPDENPDELSFLGSLVNLPRETMYRYTSTLVERQLAQTRGKWRAVLPHALANQLARCAVRSISFQKIADDFASKPRLRHSLARRLSYLHDCEEARGIVTRWMEAGGPLHDSTADIQTLEAVCHLIPEHALCVVNGLRSDFNNYDSMTRIIAQIAHSEAMFPQACESLVSLAIVADEHYGSNADNVLMGLFGLYLSGTLAKTSARVQVARKYLFGNNPNQNSRGVKMLRSALRTGHWQSSNHAFHHARPNASGWKPDGSESVDWFLQWLDLAADTALNGPSEVRHSVKMALSDEMDGLWRCVPEKVDDIARQLHDATPWAEGWHALRRILYFIKRDGSKFPSQALAPLHRLIRDMAPTDLATRAYAETVRGWDIDEEDQSIVETKRAKRLELLGKELADSPDVLETVGKDLFKREGPMRYSLGIGLGQGIKEPERVWEILRDLYLSAPDKLKQVGILSGFMHQLDKGNRPIADAIRAECRSISDLRRIYAGFLPQGVLPADELKNVVEIACEQETDARRLTDIVWCEKRKLNDDQRVCLLRALLTREDGAILVVEALSLLAFVERGSHTAWPEELKNVGVDAVIAIISNPSIDSNVDSDMAKTLSCCLRDDNSSFANRCMDAIIERVAQRYGSTHDVRCTFSELARKSPHIFLSKVFPDGVDAPSICLLSVLDQEHLMNVPGDSLIAWCNENPKRWSKVAPNISPFATGLNDDSEDSDNWSLAVEFLNAAPFPEEIVKVYLQHLEPMSWSGSQADIVEHRLERIETLGSHPVAEVGHTIARLAPGIRADIDRIRQVELAEVRNRDERFE